MFGTYAIRSWMACLGCISKEVIAGTRLMPGTYSIRLKYGDQKASTTVEVKQNPLYNSTQEDYQVYHDFMLPMEAALTEMHQMVNKLYQTKKQIKDILKKMPEEEAFESLKTEGKELIETITAWDEEMVQRKSKAYDDVENFPNKFTAEYLFLINQTESSIPKVNQASRDRLKELNAQWSGLEKRAKALLEEAIPAYNAKLWEAGIGALRD